MLTSLSSHDWLYIQFPTVVTKGCDNGQAVSSSLPVGGNHPWPVLCPSTLCRSLEKFSCNKTKINESAWLVLFSQEGLAQKPKLSSCCCWCPPWGFSGTLDQQSMKVKSAEPVQFRTDPKVSHPTCVECYLVGHLSRKAKCWTTYRPTSSSTLRYGPLDSLDPWPFGLMFRSAARAKWRFHWHNSGSTCRF